MNDKADSRKKKNTETPVHTIREGAVSASIWHRQSPAGYAYYDFSLGRSWKSMSSGTTGHSRNFFERNQAELMAVIEKACRWIADAERPQAMASDPKAAA